MERATGREHRSGRVQRSRWARGGSIADHPRGVDGDAALDRRVSPVVELSDAALVDIVLRGESEAYARLVARYRDRYARFALHMLGNREDAEEALQDAFVRAYRSLHRCGDPARFGSWLLAILANRCRTAGGKRSRHERRFVSAEDRHYAIALDHPANASEWREEIARALARLDVDQREAFLLKHVEEMEYEQMSVVTGAGVSALKMRVKRACERMRRMLTEGEDAPTR
jgi:RNA polymerase sigma-70 factor, ECF subfamily